MNEFTTKAISIICRNEDVFEFTQEHGLHGVAVCNIENPDEKWFNPRLVHSLGYNDTDTLSWKKIISPGDLIKFEKILDAPGSSGEINFSHSKGFSIPMLYMARHIKDNLVIALKKVSDYSHLETNPELNFQRERLLETILDTINVGVIACDSEGKLTLLNGAAKKWHGLPAENIPPTEFANYCRIYEPDGEKLFRTEDVPLIDMLQNGIIRNPKMIIKPENGRERFVVASGARLYDEEKNVSGAVVALHNITDWKEAEEKLKISEKTFRGIFEQAANGIATVDLSGKWLKINDRLCEMLGYSREELKKLNFKDITHPQDIDNSLIILQEMLNGTKEHFQIEKRYIHKNGEIINIILSVSMIKDADSEPLQFVSQITDVTLLKEAEKKLRISEEMFRATFKHAANGMSIADANGNFLEMNDSLCRMVGYSPDELKTMNFLEITHPDDIEDDIKVFEELLNSKKDFIHKEKRYIHKNGREVPILLSVSVVKDDDSNPLYTIGQMTDISELKSAQQELDRILHVTRDQNSRLSNFAHIVSHNLRSHSGNIEMLLDIYTEEHPEAKEDEIIQMALTASEKLKGTIKDLNEVAFLNLSVSEKMIPVNLRKSVGDTISSINALIKKANLQVFNDIPEDFQVLSVPAYMESIILNFATNAIKYRSSEREPILRFEAVKRNEFIELSIEDNGVGIDLKKYGEKLFGMYKTFHKNKDAKGIGLFITKNQIEALGGKIEVESEVNKGTVFTIFFKYEKN